MSLMHRELICLIDEAATRLEPTEYGPWLGQQTITVAGDPTVPNAPTLTASPADQAIDLAITLPSTNTNGSQYLDHKEFEIYYSTSPGIDVDDPSTYVDSFTTSSTQHTFPASTTYYFRAVAWDKYGNRSDPSSEVSATPTSTETLPEVDDYTQNIANVYVGAGMIGIEFQPPKPTWVRWAGWKLYYDVDDGTGWTGTWTHIYTGSGPGFLHKGLNQSYKYKYKLAVLAEDGTETTGTVSDNAGAGYTPNAADNSAIVGVTIFAERMIASKEMIARTFIGGVLQSTNWSDTAGSQFDLDNEVIKLGGSTSPKFHWDGATSSLSIEGNVTITGGTGVANLSDAGALATLDVVGTAQIDDLAVTTAKIADAAITTAKIDDLAVTSAKISDLTFDKITAGTNTASLVIGSGGYIKSANYSAGSAGFIIKGSGDAEFNDVTVRGAIVSQTGSQLNADYITAGTLTGILVRTASSGRRVELNPSYYGIRAYGTIDNLAGAFGADSYDCGSLRLYGTSSDLRVEVRAFDRTIEFYGAGYIKGYSSTAPVQLQNTIGRFSYSGTTVFNSTAPTGWTDLNLSSYVGTRRSLVLLRVHNNGALTTNYRFRPDGTTWVPGE